MEHTATDNFTVGHDDVILITGATGFIGTKLVEGLLGEDGLKAGEALGITLYQGRLVDGLTAARPRSGERAGVAGIV